MKLDQSRWNFLPGDFVLERGGSGDYHALAAFHYAAGPPATWADVRVVRFLSRVADQPARVAAVGVLSWPIFSCRARERVFQLQGKPREMSRFINANLRTISRVVVHPQFRSLGLATLLVRCLCEHCDTRYVEAIAMMGHAHPLFEHAGMKRIAPPSPDEPVYYILDREEKHS